MSWPVQSGMKVEAGFFRHPSNAQTQAFVLRAAEIMRSTAVVLVQLLATVGDVTQLLHGMESWRVHIGALPDELAEQGTAIEELITDAYDSEGCVADGARGSRARDPDRGDSARTPRVQPVLEPL